MVQNRGLDGRCSQRGLPRGGRGCRGRWGDRRGEKLQGSLQSPASSRTLCLVFCSLEHELQDSDHPHLFTSVSPVPHTGLTPSKCSRKEGTRAGTASSRPCPSPTSLYRAHLRFGTELGSTGPPEAHSPAWKSHAREARALQSEKAWAGAGNRGALCRVLSTDMAPTLKGGEGVSSRIHSPAAFCLKPMASLVGWKWTPGCRQPMSRLRAACWGRGGGTCDSPMPQRRALCVSLGLPDPRCRVEVREAWPVDTCGGSKWSL